MMRTEREKGHAILRIVGAAALAAALMGTGVAHGGASIEIVVGPAPAGSYYVSHAHLHGGDCGHYRVWSDGLWVYYYGGRWEYYTPGHRWAYYRAGHVPVRLRGHVTKARSYRSHAAPGRPAGVVAPRKSGHGDGAPGLGPAKPGPSKPHGTIGKGRSGPGPRGLPSKGKGPSMGHGSKGGHKK